MTTITLTDEELEDLVTAIDVSLGEGQAGTRAAWALHRQGVRVGAEAESTLPQPRVEAFKCACIDARSDLRRWLMSPQAAPGWVHVIVCRHCGREHRGRIES